MKMLSHNRLPTNQQTNRPVSDQLLELLEWLFATKKIASSLCRLTTPF